MKKLQTWTAVAAVVMLTIGIGAQGKTDPTLDKVTAEFMAAFNAKDAAKVASFYTDDGVLMPPNQPMVKGRENIEAYWRGAFEQGVTGLRLRPVESAISGAQAFETGTATVTVKAGGAGAAITDTAKYVVVYKRTTAGWKMAYDIYNSDLPPQGVK
jgi:uncharacterized protein (TIGR02246 family)